jgi:hypothetical protein
MEKFQVCGMGVIVDISDVDAVVHQVDFQEELIGVRCGINLGYEDTIVEFVAMMVDAGELELYLFEWNIVD